MNKVKKFLARYNLWIGFLAAFVPLLVLIALQSSWLMDLKESSRGAQQAVVNNYLEAVISQTEVIYAKNAERALNLPPSLFTDGKLKKAGHYFKRREINGARLLFAYNLAYGEKWQLTVFKPGKSYPLESDEGLGAVESAIGVACSPFRALAKRKDTLESITLSVDERDPDHRMILLPITDEWSQLVGVTGMVLDESYFREKVLGSVIKKSIRKFFSEDDSKNLLVTVRDGNGEYVVEPVGGLGQQDEVSKHFAFVFSDWEIGIRSRHRTAEQWARSNFALNITLSILVAVVLLGGIILALRAASRAMKLSQMKADFVSNVSHELRTPLASIRVFGEFLRLGRTRTPEKVHEYGEFIEVESRRLTQLINNILDFSRIESGHKTYNMDQVDLREVMEDMIKCFDVRLRQNGFSVIYDEPKVLIPSVLVDRDAMGQALANLMDNAVKYSGDAREIIVGLGRQNGEVQLWVQDFGIGISRQERERIFERFHRVGSSLVHDVKGFGLGLSIVSHIVDAHSGRISVRSEQGKGSTFTIHLPLTEIDPLAGDASTGAGASSSEIANPMGMEV